MHENKPPLVTNPRDPRFLALRNLQTSQGRSRTSLYLIEGIRHLARAVEEHAPIESVFFDLSVLSNRFGRKLVRRLLHSRMPAIRLSPQLYRDLTLAAEPQGIGAVLRQKFVDIQRLPHPGVPRTPGVGVMGWQPSRFSKGGGNLDLTIIAEPQSVAAPRRQQHVPIPDFSRTSGKGAASQPEGFVSGHGFSRAACGKNKFAALAAEGIYLAVESIDSPGNLGTIIRTAEAAGVNAVFLLGSDDDPWHPAAVRASMGSLFSQTLVKCTPQEFTIWARAQGVATVASSPGGLLDYRALRGVLHPTPKPAGCPILRPVLAKGGWNALLIGSEKRGLSPHLIEASDFTVRIPMRGRCDSINVAVAAGVLLFEMARPVNTTHSSRIQA